jgi:hypothetical protein
MSIDQTKKEIAIPSNGDQPNVLNNVSEAVTTPKEGGLVEIRFILNPDCLTDKQKDDPTKELIQEYRSLQSFLRSHNITWVSGKYGEFKSSEHDDTDFALVVKMQRSELDKLQGLFLFKVRTIGAKAPSPAQEHTARF